jgi:glycosyltransferase involved in cell wall biosynthesis
MGKKILMISWEYPPRITGGLGVASKGLAVALTKLGNTVDMLLPRLTGREEEIPGINLIDFKKKRHLLSEKEIIELAAKTGKLKYYAEMVSAYGQYGEKPSSIRSQLSTAWHEFLKRMNHRLNIHDDLLTGNYSNRIYDEINIFAAWAAMISTKLDFDIIHAHDWMTYKAALTVGRISGRPVICHVHSTEFDRSGDKVNQHVYDIEREAFHRATMNITVSDFTRNTLLRRYSVRPEKVRTVHNGVDFLHVMEDLAENLPENQNPKKTRKTSKSPPKSAKKRKIAPKDKIITFVGRMTFQKGPDYFVRAAKRVIDVLPNTRFVMAGTGDMYYRMIDMAAGMGMGSHFHYTGFLDNAGVSKLYNISDLYIMPSVSEPFGITPLEAMLHKVPVIISKQSGVSEIVQNAIKIDFWDINQISESIIYILKNSKVHKKMREDGWAEANKIGWIAPAEKVNSIYEEVTS